MTTLTEPATTAADRIHAAGLHALAMDDVTRGLILAEVFGILTGATEGDGPDITRARIADLLDRAVGDAIGMALKVGDRVTVEVNDHGVTQIGLIDAIHTVPGQPTVVDVELPSGRIFPQSARFVKPVAR